jgi:hypothetical protein
MSSNRKVAVEAIFHYGPYNVARNDGRQAGANVEGVLVAELFVERSN